jgi:RNA methyltransferase, TrmH family
MILSSQIKSLQHPIVKFCLSLRKDASTRKESSSFLLYGKKEILEIPKHVKIHKLFSLTNDFLSLKADHYYVVTQEILKKMTGLVEPEGYLAEVSFKMKLPKKLEKVLILDGISDPGNLGTLFRTSVAFGFDAIFLLHHCVDPFNDKALRSTKGAIFHIPFFSYTEGEFLEMIKAHDLHLYQADLSGNSIESQKVNLPFGLIVGNEAHGTSQFIKNIATAVTIPIDHKTESLNVAVASGIIMYHFKKLCQI